MPGRYDWAAARRRAASNAPEGPWQWPWRQRGRRRRLIGCLLWLLTLLVVLLVLALLFGGFQRGTKVGGSQVHTVRVHAATR